MLLLLLIEHELSALLHISCILFEQDNWSFKDKYLFLFSWLQSIKKKK